jgi:putative Holliday junction resolvase
VQENKITNQPELTDIRSSPRDGRLLCLDPGTTKVGVAVSDEIQFTVRPLKTLKRKGWKRFLEKISELIAEFDAKALVIGLPLGFEGGESEMSEEARRIARNFSLSLEIPVFLHDERLSTYTARGHLWKLGKEEKDMAARLDAEAAAVILSDFIETRNSILERESPS